MKPIILLLVSFFCVQSIFSQGIEGAWKWESTDESGKAMTGVVIIMNGFQVATWYDLENKEFIKTNGGTYRIDGDVMTETVEFDSADTSIVGETVSFRIQVTNDVFKLVDNDQILTRIDDGTPGALAGPWLISGRKRNGEIVERDTDRPRKTMKILSGTRFQWIAYNTATKDFLGTGGGTYTTKDGKYTENIEFFSRDNSRVGASLQFDFDIVDGKWHHSGYSSRGEPMFEVWSKRTK